MALGARGRARGLRLHSLPVHRAWPCTLQVEAGKRENAIVMARLRPRAAGAGAEFCVGCWHGPVAFGAPAKIQMAVLVNVAAGTRTPDHTQIVPRSYPGRARSYQAIRDHTQITPDHMPPHLPLTPLAHTWTAQAMLEFAKGTPCVLAGDFNQVAGGSDRTVTVTVTLPLTLAPSPNLRHRP